jgi:hypothetical protein
VKHIIIGIKGEGVINIDLLQIESIRLDNQAHRLLLRRAREDGITLDDAFEKTMIECIREYVAKHPLK